MRIRTISISRHLAVIGFLLAVTMPGRAQDDVMYRMEIGGGLGATAYQGDFNGSLVKGLQPAAAAVFRRVINPYSAIRVSGMYTQIKGSSEGISTTYPDLPTEGYSFRSSIVDLSATYEYNFFPYGTGRDYRGAKRVTPFISLGLGFTYARTNNGMRDLSMALEPTGKKSAFTANVPIGAGVKYKVRPRLNLSLDWQMHFSMSDKLDGVKDPYRISSSGLFKNTDCYSTLTLALTYSFSAICPTCHKDR